MKLNKLIAAVALLTSTSALAVPPYYPRMPMPPGPIVRPVPVAVQWVDLGEYRAEKFFIADTVIQVNQPGATAVRVVGTNTRVNVEAATVSPVYGYAQFTAVGLLGVLNSGESRMEVLGHRSGGIQTLVLRVSSPIDGPRGKFRVEVAVGANPLPPAPPTPYPPVPPTPYPPSPYPPSPYPPAPNPVPPSPPAPNPSDLAGYCPDVDYSNFRDAKAFAYNGDGLNMTDSAATEWAMNYNRTHRCATIGEFAARYRALFTYAYEGAYLNMTASSARGYALSLVETMIVAQTEYWKAVYTAVYSLAYSGEYLNYTASRAQSIGKAWNERVSCGDTRSVDMLKQEFRKHYEFAYASNGLNMTASAARAYALDKIRYLERCTDLLF